MRPLRETYASARMPKDPPPSEPVAVLSTVQRERPTHEPLTHGDQAFFGLDAEALRALGPRVSTLCEVAYELLERASVWFERLGGLRVGVVHAGPAGIDLPAVPRTLGLSGPVMSTSDGPWLFSAMHIGAQMIRAGEADLVLALAEDGGDGGVCLGRADRAEAENWRMEGLLSGVAVGHGDASTVAALAATRAGFPHLQPRGGTADLPMAVTDVSEGTGSVLLVEAVGSRAVALVLAPTEPQSVSDLAPRYLGLSARSSRSLADLARAASEAARDTSDLMAFAMDALRRPALEHRLAVPLGSNPAEVRSRLDLWASGGREGQLAGYVADGVTGGAVFVFPPAGTQLAGAAGKLYETEPTFRDALNRCDRVARPHLPRALLSVLFPSAGREDELDDPGYANPVTVALGWALSELLRSFGVEPAVVVGCGVGELTAAAVAGSLDPEQAMRLAVERGRLLRGIPDAGRRAVVGASEDQVQQMMYGEAGVDVVAVPRPGRVIVGGSAAAVARFVDRVRVRGVKAAELAGTPAHSPLVDPIVDEFQEAARALEFRRTDLPVVSTVTGRVLAAADPAHWVGTLRAPLRYSAAIETAWELGGRTFFELGARPTLASAGEQTLAERSGVRFVPALVPGTDDRAHLVEVLATAWVRGVPVRQGCAIRVPSPAVLPSYRFDHRPLDEAWTDDRTEDTSRPAVRWHADLPEEDAEITLVPPEELAPRSDDLLDLRPGASSGPNPLHEMFLPPPGDEDAMSVDSEPAMDITLDDLRYSGPGRDPRPGIPPVEEPVATEGDFLGQQGPMWREEWRPDPLEDVALEPTTFVVLTSGGFGDGVCAMAEAAGHRVVRVEPGTPVPRTSETCFVPDPLAEDAWMEVLDEVGTLHGAVQIVHLWSTREEDVDDRWGWPSVVSLCKEVLAAGLPTALHLVTSGAVREPLEARDAAASLWGVAGLVATETELFAGIVDVDPEDPDPALLFQHLLTQASEGAAPGWFSLREGTRQRRVLVSVAEPPRPDGVDASGAWVLGGDVDHLMLELASWLATRGVKRLYLVGATAPSPEVVKAALELQKRGTACIVIRADASEAKGAETIRQRLGREAKVSGVLLRFQPTPCALREMEPARDLARWRAALATAEVLTALAGPEVPVWAWSEAHALDGAPGNAVGACVAASLGARQLARAAAGSPSAMVHSGPHTTLASGESVRLVTGACVLGGQWGVWLP